MYVDIGIDRFEKIYDENAVMGMINNILETRKGTIPFKRDFGSNLEDYLYEPYSFLVLKKMETDIMNSLIQNLPDDIKIKKVSGEFNPDTLEYYLTINFYIESLKQLATYDIVKLQKG